MDFKNVPNKYRPIPFWSWNEKLNVPETKEQIDKMNDVGIGGFFMHARGGLQTEYMGEEWFENVTASIEQAEKHGMYPWAYDENGWPSGFGNGIVNGKGLEFQQKYLRFEEGEKQTERTITNKDGYHFYYDVNPFYVDTLDAKVTKCFIDEIYQPYYDRYKDRFCGFFTDEPQISRAGIPWSFILEDEYKARYGENLLDCLIELFKPVGDYKKTRVKFWKLVTDLFSKNYMKQIYDWCIEHGYGLTGHMVLEDNLLIQICSNGAVMPHYEYFTMPGMDCLGRHTISMYVPLQLGSVARQTGKKQVMSETYAMCGHNVGLDELKWVYEYHMVRGVNLLCQHLEGYSNRGIRKRDYPPAMYIQQPWWNDYKMFNDAMSRIGMLLVDGDDNVDTLVMHLQTTAWALHTPDQSCTDEIMKYNDILKGIMESLEAKHINFHLGDETIIERHGRVQGKYFVIGDKKYSKVILPPYIMMLDNTEKLLAEFRANGSVVITDVDEVEANPVIDIPEITYCERHCDGYDMYYFVNSTEDTFEANISVGNKIMDVVTGELYDFDGKHTFHKYESIVVIDDHSGEKKAVEAEKALKAVDLGGMWDVKACSENSLTLDYCDYYFDGELQQKNCYILNVMNRALDLERPVNIKCEYVFNTTYIPNNMFLGCEQPEIYDIYVNGEPVDKTDCGYFRDKSFRKLDIAKHVKLGENKITMVVDFRQSDIVYENLRKSKIFESEKNKLTFDMEIEQIYLIGDFAVDMEGEFEELEHNAFRFGGKYVIAEPKKQISLENVERQGFANFAGEITVEKKFEATDSNMKLDFVKEGFNVIKAKVNGKEVDKFMWEPFIAELSDVVVSGTNTIELTLVNNLRNMQGPFHLAIGEHYWTGPGSFFQEPCVWCPNGNEWNDNYCLANMSIRNR